MTVTEKEIITSVSDPAESFHTVFNLLPSHDFYNTK